MIYVDNSATTKQYQPVTQIMVKYMEDFFGNPSSLYSMGIKAEKIIKEAKLDVKTAMGLLGGNIYFTSGGTEANNTAIFGTVKALRRKGNKIVTTKVEHPSVLECFKILENEGFEVKYLDVDSKCRVDKESLENSIDDKTILVSMMHVNNETGTVMPVDYVKNIMKKKNSPGLFHCDAVQSFGKLEMPKDADLISMSAHKIHGPKGVGALYIKEGINIHPLIVGGGQQQGKRSGTENVPGIAGFAKAAKISHSHRQEAMNNIDDIRRILLKGLQKNIENIKINSVEETGRKAGMSIPNVLSISFLDTRGEVILHRLEENDIFVSTGSACASNKKGYSHVLKAMGLKDKEIEGTLRFSFGKFNTKEEMDELIVRVVSAVAKFRKLGSFR